MTCLNTTDLKTFRSISIVIFSTFTPLRSGYTNYTNLYATRDGRLIRNYRTRLVRTGCLDSYRDPPDQQNSRINLKPNANFHTSVSLSFRNCPPPSPFLICIVWVFGLQIICRFLWSNGNYYLWLCSIRLIGHIFVAEIVIFATKD